MQIRTVEAFVHGMLKKSGGTVSRIYQTWGIGIFALPVLVAIALVGLVLSRPGASNWMPEAVRTEQFGPCGPIDTCTYPAARLAPRSIVTSASISPRE